MTTTAQLLDRGFRETLQARGFVVRLDTLESDIEMGSSYQLNYHNNEEVGEKAPWLIPQDDGFVLIVEVASGDLPREQIDAVRRPDDGYSLIVWPPPANGATGGWALGMRIGDYVFEHFPGWETVVADPHTVEAFTGYLTQKGVELREYVLSLRNRAAESNPRELAFGPVQELINDPVRIESGEVPPARFLEFFVRAFTLVPDAESYETLRM